MAIMIVKVTIRLTQAAMAQMEMKFVMMIVLKRMLKVVQARQLEHRRLLHLIHVIAIIVQSINNELSTYDRTKNYK